MLNKLAIVGISGLVVCAVCISAAAAIGGKALHNAGFDFSGWGKGHRCDFEPSGQHGSRSMAWTGGDSIAIAVPAEIHYRRGVGDQVVITGDTSVLSHIRIAESTVKLDCRWHDDNNDIMVTLPGRLFKGFKIAGAGSLTLDDIDQPELKISIAGAGEVKANGKTDYLRLEMAGAGNAKLGELAANRVKVEMAGANEAVVAPKDDLNVQMAGLGNVKLKTEPRTIESDIAGAGHVTHPNELDKTD